MNEHDSPTRRLQFIVSPHTHGTTAAAEVSTPLGRVLNRDQINSRVTKVKKKVFYCARASSLETHSCLHS